MKKVLLISLCFIIISITATTQQTPFLQWQKTYGGQSYDYAASILQTSDGGFIAAGSTSSNNGDVTVNHGNSDYWIVKTDAEGTIEWQKSYGGSSYDRAACIQQTIDGGYIVAGSSASNDGDITVHYGAVGVDDYWVIKLDADGNLQWQKTYGGRYDDESNSIAQTADGGYAIAGTTFSSDGDATGNHGLLDYCIIKIDASGNRQWAKTFGGSYSEWANSVAATSDGGFIVAGIAASNDGDVVGNHGPSPFDDYWVIKFDNAGNVQWKKCYGGGSIDEAYSIKQTMDGGYIIAGDTFSASGQVTDNNGFVDYWVVKIDASGNLQWQKALGGTDVEEAKSVWQNADGSYIVTGTALSNDGELQFNRGHEDFWIAKLSTAGILEWQKDLGGSFDDYAYSIQQTTDGGFIVAGSSRSPDGNVAGRHFNNNRSDFWIVKLSPENLNDNISINPYHTAVNCSSSNSVSCVIKNNTVSYTVRLYRFGVLYTSAINVTDQISFHNLPSGAYYATATTDGGVISFSKQTDIVPPPQNANTYGISLHAARLSWDFVRCADDYTIQFRVQGTSEWKEKQSTFYLDNLRIATTYEWRVASIKRVNGIKAIGEYSNTVTFTTKALSVTDASNKNNVVINTSKNISVIITPNPAKNFFVINYKDDAQQKLNATLYNAIGKAVWNSGLINANALNGKQVNVSQFAKGVFYLKLVNENGEIIGSTKIVIAK